jgi:mono/diheme cytochrome c family protein
MMRSTLLAVAWLVFVSFGDAIFARADDVDPDAVLPGLAASYRSSVDAGAAVCLIEPKPAFWLGGGNSHPRLPVGPFEVTCSGRLIIQEPGPLAFHALVGGELRIEVDGTTVLLGTGRTDASWVGPAERFSRPPGVYRLTVHFRSLPEVPARLQLFWEGPSFAREPLPAWRLGHLPTDVSPEALADERAERGRVAVGRLGCARCHSGHFFAVTDPPPGPSLADSRQRLDRNWLVHWLDDPARMRPGARMPGLFTADRRGFVERSIIADFLAKPLQAGRDDRPAPGNHRLGRREFLGIGCAACHLVPDLDEPHDPDRRGFVGLGDRLPADALAAFISNPHSRYPDGRMPRLPVSPDAARDIAAYVLLWSKPAEGMANAEAVSDDDVREVIRSLGAHDRSSAAIALMNVRGCASCHTGLGPSISADVPIKQTDRGCLADHGRARYVLDDSTRADIAAYTAVAPRENHPSAFFDHKRRLDRAGCVRCHQRDSERPPPIEAIGSGLGGAFLQVVPYQRTPRLSNPHRKFTRHHIVSAIREGVAGLRPADYTYRMPAYGADAELLAQALAEADGERQDEPDAPDPAPRDPTLGSLAGPDLVGPRGYSCISCHIWNGRQLAPADPGAIGPDLTRVAGRIRRDWFDRLLDDPARIHPRTPMPAIFERGKPASLASVLDGDPIRQKDALWGYFSLGANAPAPQSPSPVPIETPTAGTPLVAQIPIRMPDGTVVESVSVLTAANDLLIYDIARAAPVSLLTGAQILRDAHGRTRRFLAAGTLAADGWPAESIEQLFAKHRAKSIPKLEFEGYDRVDDGVSIRWRTGIADTIRLPASAAERRWTREVMAGADVVCRFDRQLPMAQPPPVWRDRVVVETERAEGSLERPGYRAIAFPRAKLVSGEDRILPAALAVRPVDGTLFVASLKTGELFAIHDPRGNTRNARLEKYGGLFQDAFGMLAEDDGLYVLHRRNLTRITEARGNGRADRFDRIAALPHGVADTYDYAYGLVRDRGAAFVFSYAPYANTGMSGSGGVLRLEPGQAPREVAYGMRNPIGWCAGPDREVFFTDNQGEWVATNKLCHVQEGRFYGFPNPAQKQHATRPAARPAVWVPYGWARSINGVAYDDTGGRFGPFAGQFFLAELMFGGALIRADVEKVNGVYQGACFPFWGKGLLGPVSLAFDRRGHLYVGGITEPGWMAQPDRGALYRIDFTSAVPFEMRSIHARPRGFQIALTRPASQESARRSDSYRVEHFRYEYTGAYGSPELDRTTVAIEHVDVAPDGSTIELMTAPLVKDRVYMIRADGVRSTERERLVHDAGAYTVNEVPYGEGGHP